MRSSSSTPPEARSTRPRLLASVTDASEALAALGAGVDVLDLKDPAAGALGACPPQVLRAVVRLRETHDPGTTRPAVSAAIGDLQDDGAPGLMALAAAGACACGVDFVKVGVRFVDPDRAVAALHAVARAVREVGGTTRIIAATYVDLAATGAACEPEALVAIAARAELDGCLVDTAIKDGRTLFNHATPDRLARFVTACRGAGLLCALAGSIRLEDLPRAVALGSDYIGARGALCTGGRSGRLDAGRVRAFNAAIRSAL